MIDADRTPGGSTTADVLFDLYAAINRGDTGEAAELFADDARWTEPGDADGSSNGRKRGPDAVLENVFLAGIEANAVQLVPERVLRADDCTIVEGTFLGTATDGSTFEIPFAHVFELADGTVRRVTSYEDTAAVPRELETPDARPVE